jgi:hypothetical protein
MVVVVVVVAVAVAVFLFIYMQVSVLDCRIYVFRVVCIRNCDVQFSP